MDPKNSSDKCMIHPIMLIYKTIWIYYSFSFRLNSRYNRQVKLNVSSMKLEDYSYMKILQALFFPPEQPGGVSSMIPYIQERFTKIGWEMEMFSIPKRVRGKGTENIEFKTF